MKRPYLLLSFAALLSLAFAHDTQTVGEGENQYQVTVGYVNEPPYTEQLNGLDLIIRDMDDQPVENLESSLSAQLVAPDGEATRDLPLRAQYGQPGYYTSDFILTETGTYTFRISGFIGELEVDLEIPYDHEVEASSDLRFP
jgi:hypothetical protein